MARQRVRTTTTNVRTRVRKNGTSGGGYQVCNICHGSGIVRKPSHRRKK